MNLIFTAASAIRQIIYSSFGLNQELEAVPQKTELRLLDQSLSLWFIRISTSYNLIWTTFFTHFKGHKQQSGLITGSRSMADLPDTEMQRHWSHLHFNLNMLDTNWRTARIYYHVWDVIKNRTLNMNPKSSSFFHMNNLPCNALCSLTFKTVTHAVIFLCLFFFCASLKIITRLGQGQQNFLKK